MKKVITIDGPSASGKSTVSRELAKILGFPWISTGAFYRGLAYVAIEKGVDLGDEGKILPLIDDSSWSVLMEPENTRVIYKAHDVTEAIKGEKVGAVASKISQFATLRKELLERQRRCFDPKEGLIAEGRDCGTVVFPEAFLKIYLTADAEKRAQRRSTEDSQDMKKVLEQQIQRDRQDSQRKQAPMKVAEGAVTVDTTDLDLSEVVQEIATLAKAKLTEISF